MYRSNPRLHEMVELQSVYQSLKTRFKAIGTFSTIVWTYSVSELLNDLLIQGTDEQRHHRLQHIKKIRTQIFIHQNCSM